MALVSTPQDEGGSAVLLSFTALPVGRNLHIEVSKRRLERAVDCQLSPIAFPAAPPGVHLYRLCPAMPQQARSALLPRAEPALTLPRAQPDYADTECERTTMSFGQAGCLGGVLLGALTATLAAADPIAMRNSTPARPTPG